MLLTRIFSRSSQWCRMRSFTPRCTVDVRLQCIMGKPRFCVCRGLYWSLILIKIEAGHRNYCFRKVWKKSCIRIQTSVRTVNCITMNFEGCQSHGRIVVVIDYKFLPFCWQGLPLSTSSLNNVMVVALSKFYNVAQILTVWLVYMWV